MKRDAGDPGDTRAQGEPEPTPRRDRDRHRPRATLEEETRILELLHGTGAKLASNLDLQSIVQEVTDVATELSGAEFGAFFHTVEQPGGGRFTLYTLSGAPLEAFANFDNPRATPLFGPTFRGEATIRLDDVRRDPRYGQVGPHHGLPPGHLPVVSYLAAPVVSRSGEVIGGLFFGHREPGVFTGRAERLVTGIASQAAIAIDNARLYEEAKRAAEERARLLEAEREARAEVERVSLMKDEFLATLSHELRTPLNGILGWAEILLARHAGSPESRRGLEAIVRSAHAEAQIIEDLLDVNRIVSGRIRLDVEDVDLSAVVEAALDAVRPSAEGRSLLVGVTIGPGMVPVHGDPSRLQQVVWNLLTNAVKFTPTGGRIDVVVRRGDSHVTISVRDTGVGIAPELVPHVFERFWQADDTASRREGGLGLGLSIVKQLVELHGGSVEAESPGPGKGTTFTVSLPLPSLRDPS